VEPLGGVSQVMELLRLQMSENLEKLRRAGGVPGDARALPGVGARPVPPTLREALARRLRALDPADPHYQRRATSMFVESVLVAEFGDGAINDPEFQRIVRDVATTMGAERAVADDLALLFAELAAPEA
jgi:hypothetical protein